MTPEVKIMKAVEEEFGKKFKVKREVCPRCDGTGTIVNPAIDGNGLSAEDFAEDPDFKEQYLSGFYDVRCPDCDGRNVVEVIDLKNSDPELVEEYDKWLKSHYETEAIYAAERRMGA